MLSKAGFGFEDQLPVNLSVRGLHQRPATCEIKNKENEELDPRHDNQATISVR